MTKTNKTLQLLQDFESRNVVHVEADGSWPIVWERAQGVHVWDAEGKKYLDLTAAFGVAAAGHANPNVVKAGQKQMAKLARAQSRTCARVEPDHFRALDESAGTKN